MNQQKVLLINPPLLNPSAPYIAMPLLAGMLKYGGWDVQSVDLNIEAIDWLLSSQGLHILHERLLARLANCQPQTRRTIERALTVFPTTVATIDAAKSVLRSIASLSQHEQLLKARLTLRNALWIISAAFTDLEFDLIDNQLHYNSESSQSILKAVHDREKNIYRWLFERMLPSYLTDASIGLVCISVSATMQAMAGFTVAQLIRELRPDIHIAMCGNYPTRITAHWHEPHPLCALVDTFLTHECEESLLLLCEELFHGHAVTIPGMLRVLHNRVNRTSARAVNIETLPVPDFDDIPLKKYLAPGPVLPTYASRGCAWKCAFCSIPFPNIGFRLRTATRIVDEMELLAQRYHTRYFSFIDEIMSIRSLREVSNELIQRNQQLFWFGETRFAHGFTASLARQLYSSGCRRLEFGLESFNQRLLDLMKKETDIQDIAQNVQDCLISGISVHLFSIIGFPTETKEEAFHTIHFIEETLRASREVYDLPYSTSGLGPFFLDSHSAIYARPEQFSVEIIEPSPEKDLALNLDYRIKSGIDQEEGVQLVEQATHYRTQHPLQEAVWFHTFRTKDVREEAFLRACHKTGVPFQLQRPIFLPPDDITLSIVQLDEKVTLHTATCSLITKDPSAQNIAIIYQPEYDAVLELSTSLIPWLHKLRVPTSFSQRAKEYQYVNNGDEQEARRFLHLLLRFGFLQMQGHQQDEDFDINHFIFFKEEGTQAIFNEETNTGMLVSSIMGKSIEINLEALILWEFCEQGLVCNDHRLVDLNLLQGSYQSIQHFLQCLIGLGFIYAEPLPKF